MFHGNIRFFVRGGNDLKKKARKLPPGEKRIHSREYQGMKISQSIWMTIGEMLFIITLLLLIGCINRAFKQDPSSWEKTEIIYSHDEYITSFTFGYRSVSSHKNHYIFSTDGKEFHDPYDLDLEEVSAGDVLSIQYYPWFFKDSIATIRTSEKVLVSKETALLHQQNLAHSYWIVEIVFAGVFLLIWLPLFIRSRRRYLKLKARYLKQQAYFKNQQP